MKVHGQITAINSEPRNTKYGTRNVHYIVVNGERYQLGFGKIEVKAGDLVDFDEGDKGYGKEVTKGSLVVLGAAVTPGVANTSVAAVVDYSAPAPRGKGDRVFPIPALSGERAIIRQNALTQAREMVVANSLADTKHQSEITLFKFADTVIALARKFEAYAAGDLDMDAAKTEVEKSVTVRS